MFSFRIDEGIYLCSVIIHAFMPYSLIFYQSKAVILIFDWIFIDNDVDYIALKYHLSSDSHNTMSQ